MKEPTLGNPQNTIAVLQKYQFTFQKNTGRIYLIDTHVLDKIIRSAEISQEDMVLEIGTGKGHLTEALCKGRERYARWKLMKDLWSVRKKRLSKI